MSFSGDIKRAMADIAQAHDGIVRAATVELFSSVIKSTPVDTGRARGNWQTSVGAPASGELERLDPGGAQATAEVLANTPSGAGQETLLANSLPYIEKLEYGSSTQAPAGMVRINFDRVAGIVKRATSQKR